MGSHGSSLAVRRIPLVRLQVSISLQVIRQRDERRIHLLSTTFVKRPP